MRLLALSYARAPREVIELPAAGSLPAALADGARANGERPTLVPPPEPPPLSLPRRWQARNMSLIERLYPQGVTEDFHQGIRGDCYLLAALKAVKTFPDLVELLVDLCLTEVSKDEFEFRFLGAGDVPDDLRRVRISKDDIESWREDSGTIAADGDIVFERAYAALRSRRENGVMGHTISVDEDGEHAIDGGLAHVALFDLLGPDFAVKYKTGHYNHQSLAVRGQMGTAQILLDEFITNPGGYLITANSVPNSALHPRFFPVNDSVQILTRHAYTVTDYNPKTGIVTLADPRHSAQSVSLRFEEFCVAFVQLSLVRLNVLNLTLQAMKDIENPQAILDRVGFLLKSQPLHDLMGRLAPKNAAEQATLKEEACRFIDKTFESQELRAALNTLVSLLAG